MISEALAMYIYSGLYSCIIGSLVVVTLTLGQTNSTALKALISTYGILLSVFVIMCVMLGLSKSGFGIGLFMPFIVMIAITLYVFVLLNYYFDKITENKVSDYYTSFMNITSILLFIQIYVLLNEITEYGFAKFELSRKIVAMLRLFGFLNIISVITLQIILRYYTTDC